MAANPGEGRFWNGFSNMAESLERGRVVFTGGEGCYLTDVAGNRYFDASGGLWFNAVGHGRQEIADAIGSQAARLAACTSFDIYSADVTLAVADRIAALTPVRDPRVFLTSGGSDSVDSAGKIIRRWFALRGEPERTVMIAREEPASEESMEWIFMQLEQRRLEGEIEAAGERGDYERRASLSRERAALVERIAHAQRVGS